MEPTDYALLQQLRAELADLRERFTAACVREDLLRSRVEALEARPVPSVNTHNLPME